MALVKVDMRADIHRELIGPLITLVTGAAVFMLDRYVGPLPGPAAIVLLAALFAAMFGGIASTLASTAIVIGYGGLFLLEPDHGLSLDPERVTRFPIFVTLALICPMTFAALRARTVRALARERASGESLQRALAELIGLRSALDQVDHGMVLLDHELRSQHINQAYRRMWKLPDEQAESRPTFLELLQHGRDLGAFDIPDEQLDDYVSRRLALVWMGDPRPLDIRLTGGEVLRFKCTALPQGGRLLSYINVTDFVQRAEELESLVTIDRMTGVCNRAHFLLRAESEWSRFMRYGGPLALIMVDIDRFKSVNDTLGHDAGDEVITSVAAMCVEVRQAMDLVARIGGEEFAILLPETDLARAGVVAERLRERIENQPYANGRARIATTVSIGVAQADAKMPGFSALMKRADEALYAAKRHGRNRVEMAGFAGMTADPSALMAEAG